MNISFIGMSASGKTYLGKKFAEEFGFDFYDNDDALEAAYGKPIQQILDEIGERAYLEAEARVLIEGTRGRDGLIISPGGSVIYDDGAMDKLKDISSIVYINVPFETIEERLKGRTPRAIIGLNRMSLRELYDERHALYHQHADFIVEPHTHSEKGWMEQILKFLGVDKQRGFDTV